MATVIEAALIGSAAALLIVGLLYGITRLSEKYEWGYPVFMIVFLALLISFVVYVALTGNMK